MRVVVSFPGTMMDAQQAARAYYECGVLSAFVTCVAIDENSLLSRASARLPFGLGKRVVKELRRRAVTEVPRCLMVRYPWLETLRSGLARFSNNPVNADFIWDLSSHNFDRRVARRHLNNVSAVHAFEYTAKDTFEAARCNGIARVLALPSLDNIQFERIRRLEEARFPELRSAHEHYFAKRFPVRYARRQAEIELADVIVANSRLTAESHIAAGANPQKFVTAPLAAPPTIGEITKNALDINGPLSVVWAGNVTVGKGAHYFIEAWSDLKAGDLALARIYGALGLPDRVMRSAPDSIKFMGSVPQPDLFAAFERADVLVFPSLGDGFGMVVMEAFSRGLPVITTSRVGASDFIKHGNNGLIIPAADATALTDALRWCLDNRTALYGMRFEALKTASRWQWGDYRSLLIREVSEGLRRRGYPVSLRHSSQLHAGREAAAP